MRRVIIVIGILCLALSLGLWLRLRQLNAYKAAPAGGTGTVEGTEINITARLAARITAVHVREGDEVKAGQLLVELDCADPLAVLAEARARLAVAESNVQGAQASVMAARGSTTAARRAAFAAEAERRAASIDRANVVKEADRLAALHRTGAITASQLDQIETQKNGSEQRIEAIAANHAAAVARTAAAQGSQLAAAAQVEAARSNVAAAAAGVQRAEVNAAECRLVAPRAAVVQTRAYEPGEAVLPGATLLTLIDLTEVKATFFLPNAELAAAAVGRQVAVRADAYPGTVFRGAIRAVSAKAEFTPRNVQTREDRDRLVYGVEIQVPNPERKLRPGMPVEVTIAGTARSGEGAR
ncbi:MAG TPA: efflux RND transporter periplasmic adaptor subunit [Polyangia bacterium]|jgi:HlyD family secretion protein